MKRKNSAKKKPTMASPGHQTNVANDPTWHHAFDELWALAHDWITAYCMPRAKTLGHSLEKYVWCQIEIKRSEEEREHREIAENEKLTATMYGFPSDAAKSRPGQDPGGQLDAHRSVTKTEESDEVAQAKTKEEGLSLWRIMKQSGRPTPWKYFLFFCQHYQSMRDLRHWVDRLGPHCQIVSAFPSDLDACNASSERKRREAEESSKKQGRPNKSVPKNKSVILEDYEQQVFEEIAGCTTRCTLSDLVKRLPARRKGADNPDPKTVRKVVKTLQRHRLVDRPKSGQGGLTLTPKGREFAQQSEGGDQ